MLGFYNLLFLLAVAERKARGVAERRTRGGEMIPTLAIGWRASAVRGKEAWPPPRSSWRVHRCCGRSAFRYRHSRQPSGLNKLNLYISTAG